MLSFPSPFSLGTLNSIGPFSIQEPPLKAAAKINSALFSLPRARLGSSAHSLIADAHDAWLLFRGKPAINTQQLCKYSQRCRCLPTASNAPYWPLSQKTLCCFLSGHGLVAFIVSPAYIDEQLPFQLEGSWQAVKEERDTSGLESLELEDLCKYQHSLCHRKMENCEFPVQRFTLCVDGIRKVSFRL